MSLALLKKILYQDFYDPLIKILLTYVSHVIGFNYYVAIWESFDFYQYDSQKKVWVAEVARVKRKMTWN